MFAADCEKLVKLRFDLKSKNLKNVKEVGKTKVEIARILTLIKENKQ